MNTPSNNCHHSRKGIHMMIFAGLLLGLTLPAGATDPVQPPTMLELVRTYPSKDILRAVHPELFREKISITESDGFFTFYDIETGNTT